MPLSVAILFATCRALLLLFGIVLKLRGARDPWASSSYFLSLADCIKSLLSAIDLPLLVSNFSLNIFQL
jgi:hypothetical protein